MNRLEQYLAETLRDPVESMNRLQEAGIISDEAVHAGDVADADCQAAIAFLRTGTGARRSEIEDGRSSQGELL
jgi:hypothetical protein